MSQLTETLVLGALGSVLGTFLFLFIAEFWRGLARPKLEDMVYRGVRVDGRWEHLDKLSPSEQQVYTLEFVQHADRLTGTFTLCSNIHEGFSASSYPFNGYISDGFVVGTARPRVRDSIYHTTFCMRVTEDLESVSLKGKMTGIILSENNVGCWDVHFKRKPV